MPRAESRTPTTKPLGHVIVWTAALVVYLIIAVRPLRLVALDFEALVVNLTYQEAVEWPWLAPGRWAIWLGATPLGVLACAAALYRLAGARAGLVWPLGGLPWAARAGVGAGVGAAWLAFSAPFGVGLAVWLAVEGSGWVQWYAHLQPAVVWLVSAGSYHAVPALAVAGLAATAWLLRRRDEPAGRGLRVATWVGAALLLIALLPVGAVGAVHGSRVIARPGIGPYVQRCGDCHERSRALFFVKTPVEWERTVHRMRTMEGASLDDAGEADVTAFLTGMRSFGDAWTYRTRCERCHLGPGQHAAATPRDPAEWPAIVDRFAVGSPHYYRADVRDQIVAHLQRTASREDATLGLDGERYRRYRAVADRCGACHPVGRGAERFQAADEPSRAAILARMGARMVEAPAPDQLDALGADYAALIADPALLARLVPHDSAPTEDPLPW